MKLQRKTMLSLLLAYASIFTGCAKMDLKADRFTLELGEDPADYESQYVSVKEKGNQRIIVALVRRQMPEIGLMM